MAENRLGDEFFHYDAASILISGLQGLRNPPLTFTPLSRVCGVRIASEHLSADSMNHPNHARNWIADSLQSL